MIEMPFQKLQIWKKGIELVDIVYKASSMFPKEEIYGLTSQIRRAAVSIPSNIAEGSQRKTQKDFAHFALISKGSLAELHTQLIIAKNQKYLTNDVFQAILNRLTELDKMLRAFVIKLQS